MTNVVAAEADWDAAPSLLDGAANVELTVERCDLAYWFTEVAQGTLRGRPLGHSGTVQTPEYMRTPGPLREALTLELIYRSLDEEAATRVLADYVATAPGIPELEFFSTQLLDEARHHMIFRNHLIDLGHPKDGLIEWIRAVGAEYTSKILNPIREFATQVTRHEEDFVGGVVAFAIIIEGVLAASTELSELKWRVLDPVAGEIARGAAIDEIRHLAVGSSVVRQHLIDHPESREHVLEILRRGRKLWEQLEDKEFVMHRERLYQEGIQDHRELLRDYELFPGTRLIETTPEQRWDIAARWNEELADARLAYMGIPEAIDLLRAQAPRIL
ncbi:VlmB-like protein [Allorhizocola rhizosphaerae]|uniref:VlmB-like protein n=1 Tax=Allorhizocola rhizosphaerae TaxID=1872709 RepID=UPI000E3DA41B|nr:VlmB-like protein [Allorhizocola rhizosphaerae]